MNNVNIKLHEFQLELMKKLAVADELRFNQLLISGLESEHMNYHLKKLLDLELVMKERNNYRLTDKGKDYTNLMDDDVELIEKQPKTSVLLHIVRTTETDEVEHLLSKRLRQPYLGKIGRLTGKVKFGETLEQAAHREMYEETGLQADRMVLEEIYHKMRHRDDGSFVQDVLFYRFFIINPTGNFIAMTPHQENIWVKTSDVKLGGEHDYFEDLLLAFEDHEFENRVEPTGLSFEETVRVVSGY